MEQDYDDEGNNTVLCPICLDMYCPSKYGAYCPEEEEYKRLINLTNHDNKQ